MLELLCNHIRHCQENHIALLEKNGKQRLAALLLSYDAVLGENSGIDLINLIPRKDIARSIGVTPETLSRYLLELKTKNLIKESDGVIEIISRESLLRLSHVDD